MPRFDLFLLFRVLLHRAQIQSLPFVSGSLASCLDSILFYFGFSSIMPGFYYLFRHCVQIFLIFLGMYLSIAYLFQNRVRVSLYFSASRPDFSLSSSTSCPSIAYLFWNRVWLSPIFLGIVSEHRLSFSASHSAFIIFFGIAFGFHYLFRHCVRLSSIFLGIVYEQHLSFLTSHPTFIFFSSIVSEHRLSFSGIEPGFYYLFRHRV